MSFEQILGNEEVKKYLRKNLEQNNILHSYLFLGTEGIGKLLLAKEFAKYIGSCRFSSCAHISEPGCPIVEAVNNGSIAKSRHENYITLYDDLKKINSWEINKK